MSGARHTPRVDYDAVADRYDRRYARRRNEGVGRALRALAGELHAQQALEVGCGTGRWLEELRDHVPRLYGADPARRMLGRVPHRTSFGLVAARAGRLPFAPGRFDLVFCVNALHHFDDPRAFVTEAAGLLKPRGALALVGLDTRVPPSSWYVWQCFPESYALDQLRYPAWPDVLDWMAQAGLQDVRFGLAERLSGRKRGREVLSDPFLEKDANSQLLLLSDEAYAAGLRRIEAWLAEAEARDELPAFQVDLQLKIAVGRAGPGTADQTSAGEARRSGTAGQKAASK